MRAPGASPSRGLGLILDFVPNHVAPDHPWTVEHPEYFVAGSDERPRARPARRSCVSATGARQRPRPVLPGLARRRAARTPSRPACATRRPPTLTAIADQCDGVRCDMAMLMMNDIFERTWGERVGPRAGRPTTGPTSSPAVRAAHPDFGLIAEAYWDLEWALQQQGFDYCYDKRLYDRLVHGGAERCAGTSAPTSPTRRASSASSRTTTSRGPRPTFAGGQARAAAVAALTQPGARLVHEGQLEGRRSTCRSSSAAAPTSRSTST